MKINTTIMSKKGNIKLSYEIPDKEYYKSQRLKREITNLKILDMNNLYSEKLLYYNEELTKYEINSLKYKFLNWKKNKIKKKVIKINNKIFEKRIEIERIEQKYNSIELTHNRVFKCPTKNFCKKRKKYLSKKMKNKELNDIKFRINIVKESIEEIRKHHKDYYFEKDKPKSWLNNPFMMAFSIGVLLFLETGNTGDIYNPILKDKIEEKLKFL